MPDPISEPLRLTTLEMRLTPANYSVDFTLPVPGSPPDAVYVEPDGGVVVASRTAIGDSINGVRLNSVTLTRLEPTGQPDTSFGPGGTYTLPLTAADYLPVEIEPRGDGYALLLISQTAVSVASVSDQGAGGAFSVTTIPTVFRAFHADLAVLADASVRVAARTAPGFLGDERSIEATTIQTAIVAPSGQLDVFSSRRFTPDLGPLSTNPGERDRTRDLVIRPDGSVFLAIGVGRDGYAGGVVKLRPDGTLDTTFDGDGRQALTSAAVPNLSAERLAFTPGDSLLVYGTSVPNLADPNRDETGLLTRLTPSGAFDPTFGQGGVSLFASDGSARAVEELLVRASGDAVLVGGRTLGTVTSPLIVQVSDRGRVIERATGPLDSRAGPINEAGLTAEGKLVVTHDANVLRVTLADLQPDPDLRGRTPQSVAVSGADVGAAVILNGLRDGTYTLNVGTVIPVGFARGSGARVAHADIDGDGRADAVFVSGPGAAEVQIVLATGEALTAFTPFEAAYTGGLLVAARDLDGDGQAEVVVTPDQGGGPVVAIYRGTSLAQGLTGDAAQLSRFYGIADQAFRGGARVALGDISGDARPDIVVAAGDGGGPRITAWEGQSVLAGAPVALADFFAFDPTLRSGASIAVGHFTAPAQIAAGAGVGGGPHVRIFDGSVSGSEPASVASFYSHDETTRNGVRVAAIDGNADGVDELITTTGPGQPGRLKVFRTITPTAATPSLDIDVFAGESLPHGVYVG